jgi:hypothetical protein
MNVEEFVEKYGELYSTKLDINQASKPALSATKKEQTSVTRVHGE